MYFKTSQVRKGFNLVKWAACSRQGSLQVKICAADLAKAAEYLLGTLGELSSHKRASWHNLVSDFGIAALTSCSCF